MLQAYQLVMKFNRYEKITTIELKFGYMQFPAITFCNWNPYKKDLIESVQSVKDTMDVYENAKLFRKYRTKQQLSTGIIQKQSNNRNERLSHVAFGSKMANDLNVNYVERKNASRQQQRHFKRDLSFHENANEVNNEIFSLSDTNFVTDAFTTTTTTTTSATTITATTN
ncbi:unnamed protein product, partial [Acanthocheilonema viteae]